MTDEPAATVDAAERAPNLALQKAVRKAVRGTGLQIEHVFAIHLDGSHYYIELLTTDPWHAQKQLDGLKLAEKWREAGELVLTNPCATPIAIVHATPLAISFWVDPAWRAYEPGLSSRVFGEPQTRPDTACG